LRWRHDSLDDRGGWMPGAGAGGGFSQLRDAGVIEVGLRRQDRGRHASTAGGAMITAAARVVAS
jgi:hypothetical protein